MKSISQGAGWRPDNKYTLSWPGGEGRGEGEGADTGGARETEEGQAQEGLERALRTKATPDAAGEALPSIAECCN